MIAEQLLTLWNLLDERNRCLGYARYDFGDVKSHSLLLWLARGRGKRIVLKALQGIELAAPMTWRRILGIRKQVVPSLFYHLGMTYMVRALLPDPPPCKALLEHVCRSALDLRLDGEHVCWEHPYSHHAASWRDEPRIDVPLSCAHHTGRVGLMLLKAGQYLDRPDLREAGTSAAKALMTYHNWQVYPDKTCTVSYYPHTRDEVINTGADAAVLLAAVPSEQRTSKMQESLEGLVRMVVSEQQTDGSWHYCTRRHYERFGGARVIDNHHTAMNLCALAVIGRLDVLPRNLAEDARDALERGTRFYLNELFLPDGRGLHLIGSRQSTGIVGYSEGVSALSAYLGGSVVSSSVATQVREMIPKMIAIAVDQFVNLRTGDVACYRFFGRPFHIQSSRWGSAPLMQAITDYLRLSQQNE